MDARLTAAVVLMSLAACGGAEDAAETGTRDAGSAAPEASTIPAEQEAPSPVVLSELPEACSLPVAGDVEAILGEAVSGDQLAHAPKERSACRFTASDGSELTFQIFFIIHQAYDPSVDPPDKLRAQVAHSSGEPAGELNGSGYHGFYVESSDTTRAHVVTEFQGTAITSDRPVTQLHLTVQLESSDESADRLDAVRRTVESVIGEL